MAMNLQDAPIPVTACPLKTFDNNDTSATCDDGAWNIVGTDSQIIQFALKPGQCVTAEPGIMVFTSYEIKPKTVFAGCCQAASGEDMFKTEWTNEGTTDGYVGVTGNEPSTVVPVNLKDSGGTIYCKLGAYICSTGSKNTRLRLDLGSKKSCAASCANGLFMQTISSKNVAKDVWVFLGGFGTIMETTIPQGKTVYLDPDSLVGWSSQVYVDVKCFGDCQTCCVAGCCARGPMGGGEPPFMYAVTAEQGDAKLWIQSLPIAKLKRALGPPDSKPGEGKNTGADGVPVVV